MTHITPPDAWYATFVNRWHSGQSSPWLAKTGDNIGGHSGRMAALALHFWGDGASRELLVACIVHDLGEYSVADVPCTAKRDPTLRATLDRLEDAALARMRMTYSLSIDDADRLRFLDRLDAYLWAQHHAPDLVNSDAWFEDYDAIFNMAERLKVTL